MTYEEARKFITKSNRYGIVPGLSTITELLHRLGDPQEQLKIIHVGGTNGKGSTCAFLTSILCASGYKVGRFLSPAVYSYRERIQVSERDTNHITKEGVQEAIEKIRLISDEMVLDGFNHPTTFEIETAMAFLYLLSENVDYAIIEVGMGGRQDATNVITKPICSVITSISKDHMQYLGDSLKQIASEKAGIIKKGCPLITCNQKPEVIKVLEQKAKEMNSPLYIADTSNIVNAEYSLDKTCFSYLLDGESRDYQISLLGNYQVTNAIIAIETALYLSKAKSDYSICGHSIGNIGNKIYYETIRKGLNDTQWHGRFEQVSKKPDIYIDGAHNEEAALRLRDSIEIYFTNRRIIFMIGVLADKDYQSILQILAPLANTIITLTPDNHRALPSDILANEAKNYCDKVYDGKEIKHAIKLVCKEAESGDVIIAFGSLSFLGSLVRYLNTKG